MVELPADELVVIVPGPTGGPAADGPVPPVGPRPSAAPVVTDELAEPGSMPSTMAATPSPEPADSWASSSPAVRWLW